MPRRMTAKSAADQIETLINGGHYKTPEEVAKVLPQLSAGVNLCNKRTTKRQEQQEAARRAAEARRPVGSGSALLSR